MSVLSILGLKFGFLVSNTVAAVTMEVGTLASSSLISVRGAMSCEAEALLASGSAWLSLPSVARHLLGTRACVPAPSCSSLPLLLGILGGFEVSLGHGNAIEADPKPYSFWLCLVGICGGVTPRLCF